MSKSFRIPFDTVLYDMSYQNCLLYSSVLPSYKVDKKKKEADADEEVINGDDPRNNDKIRALFG